MRRYKKENGFGRYAAALLGGLLCAVPFLLLSAALVRLMGRLPTGVLRVPAVLGWGAAAFVFAWRTGFLRRHRGLVTGLLCGGMIWGIRLAGAVCLGEAAPGMLWDLAWLLPFGGIGGIVGVNTRRLQKKCR